MEQVFGGINNQALHVKYYVVKVKTRPGRSIEAKHRGRLLSKANEDFRET